MDPILKEYPDKVKFVYKQFPLTSIHKDAMNSSKASLAAAKQGKFWEYHDKLFANQRALGEEQLKQYARDIGLDMEQFEKDYSSPEIQNQINQEMALAQKCQVRGTPTLFIGGKRVTNRSADAMKAMVEEALKEKKAS